ncbi:MAG: GNAT family N-acetyltransferase [Bacteroidales bacterium]|nr:GNAT family N-acetyltransferase [Bacteroidales bacterium]
MTSVTYRYQVKADDPDTIETIVRSTGFFYEDEIPIARELAEETLLIGDKSGYRFVFAEVNGQTLGYAAYGFIDGTDACYDLYWIAVHEDARGKGLGKGILNEVVKSLKQENGRQLIAETSSLPKYKPTREFYLNTGFIQQAVLPDFFREGDHKVFFVLRTDQLS